MNRNETIVPKLAARHWTKQPSNYMTRPTGQGLLVPSSPLGEQREREGHVP